MASDLDVFFTELDFFRVVAIDLETAFLAAFALGTLRCDLARTGCVAFLFVASFRLSFFTEVRFLLLVADAFVATTFLVCRAFELLCLRALVAFWFFLVFG